METTFTPAFVDFKEEIHREMLNSSRKNMPSINPNDISALAEVLKAHSQDKVVKVWDVNKKAIINIIVDPKIARLFTEYYRDDRANPKNPFNPNLDFAAKYLLGDDSIMTCKGHECKQIRGMLIKFMNQIKNTETLEVCQSVLKELTGGWLQDHETPVKEKLLSLQKIIPDLIAQIGIEGIMEFPNDAILATSKHMDIIAIKEREGNTWYSKIFYSLVNGVNTVRKIIAAVKIKKLIRDQIANQVRSGATHSFLRDMQDHTRKRFNIQASQPLTNQAIEMIAHNYSVILFAFQETTTSILKHMIWHLACDQELQQTCRQLCLPIQQFYDQKFNSVGSSQVQPEDQKEYFERLSKLDPIIAEFFRLYSPGEITRSLKQSVINDGEREYVFGDDEKMDYSPFYASRLANPTSTSEAFNLARLTDPTPQARSLDQVFMPFGNGVHLCPGQKSALLQLKIILAFILTRFEFTTEMKQLTWMKNHVITTKEDILVTVKSRT